MTMSPAATAAWDAFQIMLREGTRLPVETFLTLGTSSWPCFCRNSGGRGPRTRRTLFYVTPQLKGKVGSLFENKYNTSKKQGACESKLMCQGRSLVFYN